MEYLAYPKTTGERARKELGWKNHKLLNCLIHDVLKKKPLASPEGPLPDFKPEDFIMEHDLNLISKKIHIKYFDVKQGLKKLEELKFLKILLWDGEKDIVKTELTFDVDKEEKGGVI